MILKLDDKCSKGKNKLDITLCHTLERFEINVYNFNNSDDKIKSFVNNFLNFITEKKFYLVYPKVFFSFNLESGEQKFVECRMIS